MNRHRRPSPDARDRPHLPPEEAEPERFRWIVDGHNAIFAVPEWEALQLAGEKRAARLALEESLESFGRAAGVQVVIVYDGNHLERNPDAVDRPHLRSEYSFPPEEADDRIRFLVHRALLDQEHPIVVTSDRRTLADSLPAGVRVLSVRDFFHRVRARLVRQPEKWSSSEGFEDVERHFLALAGEEDASSGSPDGADTGSGAAAEAGGGPEAGAGGGPEADA